MFPHRYCHWSLQAMDQTEECGRRTVAKQLYSNAIERRYYRPIKYQSMANRSSSTGSIKSRLNIPPNSLIGALCGDASTVGMTV